MKKKGSLTIELSLLMPVILFSIILIIYATYFYHDRCIIQHSAYSTALKRKEKNNEISAEELFRNGVENKLIGVWDLSVEEVEGALTVQGKMNCFDGLLFRLMSDNFFAVNITEYLYSDNEADYIRGY